VCGLAGSAEGDTMKIRYTIEIEVEPPPFPIREMLLNQSLGWEPDSDQCSVCGSTNRVMYLSFYLGSEYGSQRMSACRFCESKVKAEMGGIRAMERK